MSRNKKLVDYLFTVPSWYAETVLLQQPALRMLRLRKIIWQKDCVLFSAEIKKHPVCESSEVLSRFWSFPSSVLLEAFFLTYPQSFDHLSTRKLLNEYTAWSRALKDTIRLLRSVGNPKKTNSLPNEAKKSHVSNASGHEAPNAATDQCFEASQLETGDPKLGKVLSEAPMPGQKEAKKMRRTTRAPTGVGRKRRLGLH